MPIITTPDGTSIYYKDWGKGQPIVFSHGWPLSADAWEDQMMFLATHGYRCIAHDRRGHGRSSQPWTGNDMDTYADDLHTLIESLDLHDAVLVGHSTGGGEVARYIGRYGTKRVAKTVLIGSVTPFRLQTPDNPGGQPLADFDVTRAKVQAGRSQFFQQLSHPFFGEDAPQGLRDTFWLLGMQAGLKGVTDCIKAFSESDFRDDLLKFNIPTLIIHGDADEIVPLAASAIPTSTRVPNAVLHVYPGAPHGLCSTHKDKVNDDILAFIQA